MSEKKIQFSESMQAHLVRQADYYASLTQAVTSAGCRYLVRPQEVGVSEQTLANGDVQVRVSFPIDDNKTAADGQIQLRDTFVLSSDGRRVRSFDRRLEYNQKGPSILWQTRLNQFRKVAPPSSPLQQQFADHVLSKPLVMARIKASKAAVEFMTESGFAIQGALQDKQVKIHGLDTDSHMTVEKSGTGYVVKFHWVVDNDNDRGNGRHLMEDQFFIEPDGKTFKKHLRQWRVHPDSSGSGDGSSVALLYGAGKPSKAKAQAFVEAVLPVLFSTSTVAAVEAAPKREAVRVDPVGLDEGRKGGDPTVDIGQIAVVSGPKVRDLAPKGREGSGGAAFQFSFSQHSKIERNTNAENAGGLITRAVGPSLRAQLGKRGVSGAVKFNFAIKFDKASGYVTHVEATLLKDDGLGLSRSELQEMLKSTALRIHLNLRADGGLAGDTLWVPLSLIIRE